MAHQKARKKARKKAHKKAREARLYERALRLYLGLKTRAVRSQIESAPPRALSVDPGPGGRLGESRPRADPGPAPGAVSPRGFPTLPPTRASVMLTSEWSLPHRTLDPSSVTAPSL